LDQDWPYDISATGIVARNGRPLVSEVAQNLLIGEYPRVQDIPWLGEVHGITTVVSLQDADDLRVKGLELPALERAYAEHRLRFHRIPVADYDSSQLAAQLDQILIRIVDALAAGQRVYVHCNAGMNRAPTVAIAYLHRYRGCSLSAALDLVKSRRACAPYMQLLYERFGTTSS
jgi:protein-tyrosine phosphatase